MTATPGRRAAATRRRRDPLLLVAVLVPVITVGLTLLVDTDAPTRADRSPVEAPLTRVDVLCPPADGDPVVASLADQSGTVSVATGNDDPAEVDVSPHTPAPAGSSSGPASDASGDGVVVTGRDQLAPGLVAGRFASPLASADCRPPLFDQWFTGVGAGPKHASVLQLVNPDGSRALVDVEVLTSDGVVDVPDLRGLAVPGHQTVSVDLAEVVPRSDDLALHVTTLRGRVGASVADSFDRLGGLGAGDDTLPAQTAPRTTNLLLGPPEGPGRRTLLLANPGDDEGRATVKLVTEASTFAPEGVGDVTLPPHSVVRVGVGDVVKQAAGVTEEGQRLVGLSIDSTVPVTADLLSFLDSDLTHATSLDGFEDPAAAVLPEGAHRLELAGATGPGAVTVTTWDADGTALPDQRVEVTRDGGAVVDLPDAARLVRVEPDRTPISAVVLTSGTGTGKGKGTGTDAGTALVQLRVPRTTGLVPDVLPGLP